MSVTEAELIAGEAYQIIGSLSHYANMFDHPEVQRALDWFSGFEPGITYKDDASILPWPKEELKPDDYSALAARIEALEEALREAALQIEYLHGKFQETGSGNAVLARIWSVLAKKDSAHA